MVEAFQIPLRFKIDARAKRELAQLQVQAGGATGGGRRAGGRIAQSAGLGGLFGGAGGVAGSFAKALGIGTVIGVALQILNQFKAMTSVIGVIVKVLIEFLRPISDVIIVLLLPILQVLKPILQVVRQVMQPFRQLAFSLSRQGAQALKAGDKGKATGLFNLSTLAALTGLQAVIGALLKVVIDQVADLSGAFLKGISAVLINLMAPILSFLGVNVEDLLKNINTIIDNGTALLKASVGLAFATAFSAQTLGIAKMAELLGVDVSKEYAKVNEVLGNIFIGSEGSIKNTFDKLTDTFENQLIGDLDDALLGPNGIVGKFEEAARRINRIDVRGEGRGSSDFVSRIQELFVSQFKRAIQFATPIIR